MYVSTRGMGCAECGGGCKGMGSIDFSSLGWEDYALVGVVALLLLFREPPKRKRGKVSGKAGFAGGLGAALALGVGGYFAYQYFVRSGASAG